jgi:hypothetical protein
MRRLVPLALAVLALTLAACGSGSGSTAAPTATGLGALALIAGSVDKAAELETARMGGEVAIETGGRTMRLPLDGAIDFGSGAFEFTYDMSQMGIPGADDAKIEARLVDGVMYMNFGDLGSADGLSAVTGGKHWAKIDLAAFGPGAGGALGEANPGGALEALRGAETVETIGTDTLRGTETTHYRATVDPAKALDQAPPALRERVQAGLELFDGPLPVDVWIDGDGRARQITIDVDLPVGSLSMTMEYYDYGVDVDVSAPPADDVFDFSQLLGGVAGAGSTGIPVT